MKKLLVMVAATMMAATSVKAQIGYSDTKHEVAVSLGGLSNSQWIDVFEDMINVMFNVSYDEADLFGPVSVEYFYHLKNWLGVGGIFVYGSSSQDVIINKSKSGDGSNTYLTLMPAAKFDWLRKKNFGMYSKAAIGATLRTEKIDWNDSQKDDYSESELHLNWQMSLLGIEAGTPTLRGFIEMGFGEQGIGLIGVRYKF